MAYSYKFREGCFEKPSAIVAVEYAILVTDKVISASSALVMFVEWLAARRH